MNDLSGYNLLCFNCFETYFVKNSEKTTEYVVMGGYEKTGYSFQVKVAT